MKIKYFINRIYFKIKNIFKKNKENNRFIY